MQAVYAFQQNLLAQKGATKLLIFFHIVWVLGSQWQASMAVLLSGELQFCSLLSSV